MSVVGHWSSAEIIGADPNHLFVDAEHYAAGPDHATPGPVVACIPVVPSFDGEHRVQIAPSISSGGEVLVVRDRVFVLTTKGLAELRGGGHLPSGTVRNFRGDIVWSAPDPAGGRGDGLVIVVVQLPRRKRSPRRRMLTLTVDTRTFPGATLPDCGSRVRGSHYETGHVCIASEGGALLAGELVGAPLLVPNRTGRTP